MFASQYVVVCTCDENKKFVYFHPGEEKNTALSIRDFFNLEANGTPTRHCFHDHLAYLTALPSLP